MHTQMHTGKNIISPIPFNNERQNVVIRDFCSSHISSGELKIRRLVFSQNTNKKNKLFCNFKRYLQCWSCFVVFSSLAGNTCVFSVQHITGRLGKTFFWRCFFKFIWCKSVFGQINKWINTSDGYLCGWHFNFLEWRFPVKLVQQGNPHFFEANLVLRWVTCYQQLQIYTKIDFPATTKTQ